MSKSKDILISFYFFIFYLSLSLWLPFYNLYLKDIGFSGAQVGVIAGVYQAALFFVVPVWGMFSDRKGVRLALRIAMAMSTALLLGIQFIHPFILIIGYMLILAFFHHPIGSLLDSLSIHHTQQGSRLSYGAMRVWGSIGWAIGSTLMGRYLITHNLNNMFPVAAIFYAVTMASLFAIGSSDTRVKQEHDFSFRHVARVFGSGKIILLLVLLTLYGFSISPLYIFINLYYNDIGAGNNMVGIAFAVQAASEIPFFFYGRRIVSKIGAPHLLVGVMIIAMLRLLIYSLVSDPITAVILGVAQGATLSLFWVGIVDYLHRLIPPAWRGTGQSLIWAFHLGAGVTLGNIVIGSLSDYFPMQRVMLLASGATLIVIILFIVYLKKYAPVKQSSHPENKPVLNAAKKSALQK